MSITALLAGAARVRSCEPRVVYAESIVSERLGLAQEELGFTLQYHSPSDIDEFNARLERKHSQIYEAARALSQGTQFPTQTFQLHLLRELNNPDAPRLTSDEIRFMTNERMVCMCDAAYFLTRYYFIKTPQAIQRFAFLPGQKVYFNVVAELEALRASIELICNKARQHGISTETEGLEAQRICFYPGTNAVIASADRVMAAKMAQMTFFCWDMMPWWIKPVFTRRVESDQGMLVFGSMNSGVSIQHGKQTSGIARGDTVKVYHLSEVSSYPDAGAQIDDALHKCVHPHPDVFGVLESTAMGDTGWFYEKYWYAKKNFVKGKSRLCALFLPWFLGTDKYPTPTWLRTRQNQFKEWRPMNETNAMCAKAKMYVASNSVLQKVLGPRWELPREQAFFWEANWLEYRDTGREKK